MEQKILSAMNTVFGLDNITTSISQENCEKWDSLNHLNLIVELESCFDVTFEPEEIAVMTTFDKVLEIVEQKSK